MEYWTRRKSFLNELRSVPPNARAFKTVMAEAKLMSRLPATISFSKYGEGRILKWKHFTKAREYGQKGVLYVSLVVEQKHVAY
jgi:hypothetical protein